MEECERHLEKSKFVLCHNNKNCTAYSRCCVPLKLNLWSISGGVWLLLSLFGSCYCSDGPQLQPPHFTTQPSSSGSIVSEGRTKFLQCHAFTRYQQTKYRRLKDAKQLTAFSSSIIVLQKKRLEEVSSIAKNEVGSIFSEK